jgi:hypothetical protein
VSQHVVEVSQNRERGRERKKGGERGVEVERGRERDLHGVYCKILAIAFSRFIVHYALIMSKNQLITE